MTTPAEKQQDHILKETSPGFLLFLDGNPSRAFEGFYLFAKRMLSSVPPRILWQVPEERREDVVHEVILHCCQDDFRVLRKYRDRGKPFAAWFSFVARNRITDMIRKEMKEKGAVSLDVEQGVGAIIPDNKPLPDHIIGSRNLLSIVSECIGEMGESCRLLLMGAADGLKPRELARLMGWPRDWNKKASDDLRECRKKLKARLTGRGLGPGDLALSNDGQE